MLDTISPTVSPAERAHVFCRLPRRATLHSTTGAQSHQVRSLPLPRRPKVPLLSGSVLVLLTLFLPIGYWQCGTIRGSDYLLGLGSWPGALDALSDVLGRVPYFLTLLLAALTLLLVLAAQIRPSLLQRSRLNFELFAATGTLLLFMVGDLFGFQLTSRTWNSLKPRLTGSGQSILMLILAISAIAIAVICLRSRLLRSQRWIVSLFAIVTAISLFVIVNCSLALFRAAPIISPDWALLLAISPSILYFVIPLGLWHHFGLSQRAGLQMRWPGIRHGIALLYLPVAAFDLLALGLEMRPGRLRGLLPFFMGLGLMFWGYAVLQPATEFRRRRAASAAQSQAPAAPSHGIVSEIA